MNERSPDPTDARTAVDLSDASGQRRGPNRIVIGVLVAVVVAVAGLAAGGLPPSELIDRLRGEDGGEVEIDLARAVMVASDSLGEHEIAVWAGPGRDGDDVCAMARAVWPSGSSDAAPRCERSPLPWTDEEFTITTNSQYFGWVDETPIGSLEDGFGAVGLTGAVHPAITAITARFGDGTEYSFSPTPPAGWFAVLLPEAVADMDRVDGHLVNGVVELELFDADGRVLTTVDDPALLP